jgi:hypothetical protein
VIPERVSFPDLMKILGINSHEAKYNPTRAQESSHGSSDKEPSQPHTPTSQLEVLDFKNHSGELSHVSDRGLGETDEIERLRLS